MAKKTLERMPGMEVGDEGMVAVGKSERQPRLCIRA